MNRHWRKPCFDWLWLLAECIAKKRGSGVVYDPQNLENSSLSPHKVLTYLHLNSRARRTLVRCFPSYKLFLVFYHIILMISNISTALESCTAYRSLECWSRYPQLTAH